MLYFGCMESEPALVPGGGVTTPRGFVAGATGAGIKYARNTRPDLAILSSTAPCRAAGVFTANRVKAAPVLLCQRRLLEGEPSAIVVNSGCANACTGEQGMADAVEMAALAAAHIGKKPGGGAGRQHRRHRRAAADGPHPGGHAGDQTHR